MNFIRKLFCGKLSQQVLPESPIPEKPKWVKKWDEFVVNHPTGSQIKHLGLDLTVRTIYPSFFIRVRGQNGAVARKEGFLGYWNTGSIECEYVDMNGVIRYYDFDREQSAYLAELFTGFEK